MVENGLQSGMMDKRKKINKKKVISKLKKIENFKMNKKIANKYFVQFVNDKNNIKTFIDF